jgi:uncharacterized Tic20 family protein
MTEPSYSQPAPQSPLTRAQDYQWASFGHLGGIIGPLPVLIIWLVFKDRGPFTNQEGKEALNFQISAVIAYVALTIITAILSAVTLGIFGLISPLLFLALWVVMVVFSIQGFLKAKDGIAYRYPLTYRFIK